MRMIFRIYETLANFEAGPHSQRVLIWIYENTCNIVSMLTVTSGLGCLLFAVYCSHQGLIWINRSSSSNKGLHAVSCVTCPNLSSTRSHALKRIWADEKNHHHDVDELDDNIGWQKGIAWLCPLTSIFMKCNPLQLELSRNFAFNLPTSRNMNIDINIILYQYQYYCTGFFAFNFARSRIMNLSERGSAVEYPRGRWLISDWWGS